MKDVSTQLKSLWGDIRELKKTTNSITNIIETSGKGNIVSVMDYGAKGDGATDDTNAIQSALFSGNQTIWFPPGIYNITSQVKVNSNTTLIGYGATLLRKAAIDNVLINNADGVTGGYLANTNMRFYGLHFNGNKANFPSNCTTVAIGHANTIVFVDCEFSEIAGTWHGLELNACQDVLVEGCYFHDGTGQEHFQLDLAGGSSLFPWFGPFDSTPCNNIVVNGNLFTNGTSSGFGSHSGSDPNQHSDIVVSNNVFRNFANGNALNMYNYRNVTIIGNIIEGAGVGITAFRTGVIGVENWIISNNQFFNLTNNGLNLFNIKGLVISNNTFNHSVAWGISVQTSDNVVITGNIVKNAGSSTTTDYGALEIATCTNTYIANNTLIKDPAGLGTGVNTIKATLSTNVTIENNTVVTPGATTVLANLAGVSYIVGANTINTKITPFINSVVGSYTYTPTDKAILVDTSGGNATITINPAIFNKAGLRVKKTTADANTVTITPSSGTINGAASLVLTTQNETTDIQSDWVNLIAITV